MAIFRRKLKNIYNDILNNHPELYADPKSKVYTQLGDALTNSSRIRLNTLQTRGLNKNITK